jgi:hypothetical protein
LKRANSVETLEADREEVQDLKGAHDQLQRLVAELVLKNRVLKKV